MVKIILTTIVLFLSVVCFCQEKTIAIDKLDFKACFSKDSTCFNDTVEISLFYKNKTEKQELKIYFPTNSRIVSTAIGHEFSGDFIFDDSASRILYTLKNPSNEDSIMILKPHEIFIKKFNVIISPDFFYSGRNTLYVFHRVWNYPMKSNKRKRRNREPYISLISSPDLYLYVEQCKK